MMTLIKFKNFYNLIKKNTQNKNRNEFKEGIEKDDIANHNLIKENGIIKKYHDSNNYS